MEAALADISAQRAPIGTHVFCRRPIRCGKQFDEHSTGQLNRTQYPSDVIALVVLWSLRYKLSLRDLAEIRGFVFTK
jgi:hypothetical protein